MLIRTWAAGEAAGPAQRSDQVKLYKVRRAAGEAHHLPGRCVGARSRRHGCRTQLAASRNGRWSGLVVKGTTFGIGDRDETPL